jgi:flagellar assembly factor FliW
MKVATTRFGEVEIDEGKIITFPLGIPGFPELKRYFLVDYKDPIRWLHAVDDSNVAFIVMDPFSIFTDYSIKVDDETERFLDIKEPTDTVIFTILTIADNVITANLKAPIIINSLNFRAAQILLEDERYSFKAPLPALPAQSDPKETEKV